MNIQNSVHKEWENRSYNLSKQDYGYYSHQTDDKGEDRLKAQNSQKKNLALQRKSVENNTLEHQFSVTHIRNKHLKNPNNSQLFGTPNTITQEFHKVKKGLQDLKVNGES
mmetsp:Transcript_43510/g.41987  ORF Transcript_43510/g.41987 Transcript_43510/m.41987 type:complete len:110 (-) Transcript_43510:1620-1949(-)